MKIGLICGGPSLERGISLNSARSVLDHLSSENIEIVPFYLDEKKKPYKISSAQLYSNTPSDFDFKLKETAKPLTEHQFVRALKKTDVVFPAMHGPYGEDGGIQHFFEKHDIPFIGSGSEACKKAFDKFISNRHIKKHGFCALPSTLLKIYGDDHEKIVHDFFEQHKIERAVVKPATGGSSIGVFSVSTPTEALAQSKVLFSKRMDTRVVVEEFAQGKEFTVIVLQNPFGLPVALPPTEMELSYDDHQIFDFRKKYLPTRHVTYHCPPRFDDSAIEKIQAQAAQLFSLFGMRDFARFDGWVLPSGEIWFCDFNTISGMEQNSFLFQQASRVGLTHAGVLRYILKSAAARYQLSVPEAPSRVSRSRKPVSVLFGGPTSERQVSLMSGTNVWLKLRNSTRYEPHPYLLDTDGTTVWRLPYHLTLNHTVEEIAENCASYQSAKERLMLYEKRARLNLGLSEEKDASEFFDPERLPLAELFDRSKFVFIALHGGDGENGELQQELAKRKIPFNGPTAKASKLCIDKWATGEHIRRLDIPGVSATVGTIIGSQMLLDMDEKHLREFWSGTKKTLDARSLVVKPRGDGCSTGVVHLFSPEDLAAYRMLLKENSLFALPGTFTNQAGIIEMPPKLPEYLVFEKFVETDILRVKSNKLKHTRRTGCVEVTIGVVEEKGAGMHAFNPSITVSEGEVLSVEEKFQGGTGVNLTPPPSSIIKPAIVKKVKERIELLAKEMGIRGYSRIDAFVHTATGEVLVIEINTLPGLTPSTVLYHQGLAENPPLFPRALLETLVENKGY